MVFHTKKVAISYSPSSFLLLASCDDCTTILDVPLEDVIYFTLS